MTAEGLRVKKESRIIPRVGPLFPCELEEFSRKKETQKDKEIWEQFCIQFLSF